MDNISIRKNTTSFLSNILVRTKLTGLGKHFASEVTFDMGTDHTRRVDYVLFEPAGGIHVSDIEKGIFTCFEIKSCREDVYSGNGMNFFGEKNYLVTTMEAWKSLLEDFRSGKLDRYVQEYNNNPNQRYGVMVAVPVGRKAVDEFDDPTEFSREMTWQLDTIIPCRQGKRDRPLTEMLFCMLRAGR